MPINITRAIVRGTRDVLTSDAARAAGTSLADGIDNFVSAKENRDAATDAEERELIEGLTGIRQISLIGRAEEEVQDDLAAAKNRRLGKNTGVVTFSVQPIISETGTATYLPIDDIRQAASMLIYMGSPSREFSINAKFVSRTKQEADTAWKYVQILRSWRKPEAPKNNEFNMKSPSRLSLRGFSGWFNEIPVRLTSLNSEMPDDVDYIKSHGGQDVPIIWPVTLSLKESRSPTELQDFNIEDFRTGKLGEW